ncbi:hypothetical protein CEUSTIGMA_g3523.t1 [Chlamydomonas eustigma]|uniref:shikimate dehydrogenase (NADP(+)) n=1 Tax=Chlamydomonas eustigma TaxID=1157962 RepID=A0A250X000_9CHLO|nr:hypothetical protein CEUSTIGMA_g3523.t1 [Chlamydomonas eustigma]|eukprot:GAX76080.1 hypothetical protein CEUSTIGMA_g3523.t1 [Chlamydomonas eustigma]
MADNSLGVSHFLTKARVECRAISLNDATSTSTTMKLPDRSLVATSITATSFEAFMDEMTVASTTGADILELRLDFIQDFDTERDLKRIMSHSRLPYIVTYRPKWEWGNYNGEEATRLATLKYAAMLGAPFIDVEFKAADTFFASAGEVPVTCKVILSAHDFNLTPSASELKDQAYKMYQAGADIVKIAAMATDITDAASMLSLLQDPAAPTISLSMGEKGQITRLLSNKFGGFLTFAALSPEKASAPGQPTIQQLNTLFKFKHQSQATKLFGIIGNPVSHSRSPLIHNTAFQDIGFDGVYVPLLVDDLSAFLDAFKDPQYGFSGFSVTIPHKEAALKLASSVDPLAAQIGAVNTLIRQSDGTFKGYNTDCSAAIGAIEKQMIRAAYARGEPASAEGSVSPLWGKTFLVLGAGGAGRALAFGAASRGARVLITNRSRDRAEALAAGLGPSATVVDWEAVQQGEVRADVCANSTSLGMSPRIEETPIPRSAVGNFGLVFDSVYTPVWTRLLLDARDAGCEVVDGLQMFVGQAAQQFRLFTGHEPPLELMQETLMAAISAASVDHEEKK